MNRKMIVGNQGEHLAEQYLLKKGYKILTKNYRMRGGEIDIIARINNDIVFLEVKSRTGIEFGDPIAQIGLQQQKTIIQTANHYLIKHNIINKNWRIDVITVLFYNNQITINHIINAINDL